MDVRACIEAKAQKKSIELQRDSISENVRWRSRMFEIDVGEQKNASTITKLYENCVLPNFVIRPADTYIIANQTGFVEARFNQVITGKQAPISVVKWYKNGQLITGSQFPRVKKHHYEPDTYVLEIRNATEGDMGTYTCVARNCYGRVSSSATVRIIELETEVYPRFLKRLQSIDVFAGKNGRLEVRVSGTPKPEVRWYKNGIPLKENCRIEIRHFEPYTYVLNIKNADVEDSGLYTCQGANDVGTRSSSAIVHVERNEKLYIYRPLARVPHELPRDNDSSEVLTRIRRQLERRRCPEEWSQKEKDDLLYKISVTNYHMKYRIPTTFDYRDLL